MNDFVIRDREYPHVPDLLLEAAPSFGSSEEFAGLEADDRKLPSVVCGAFARYVERLMSPSAGDSEQLSEALSAMERLATSPDPEVVNALVVNVFEHLNLADESVERFRSSLGPSARALFKRWIVP